MPRSTDYLLVIFVLFAASVGLAQVPSSAPESRLAHLHHGINLSEWFAQVWDPNRLLKNYS
jgi:hypothetical protein